MNQNENYEVVKRAAIILFIFFCIAYFKTDNPFHFALAVVYALAYILINEEMRR